MQDEFDFRPIFNGVVCVLTFTRSRVPNKERNAQAATVDARASTALALTHAQIRLSRRFQIC